MRCGQGWGGDPASNQQRRLFTLDAVTRSLGESCFMATEMTFAKPLSCQPSVFLLLVSLFGFRNVFMGLLWYFRMYY